MSKKLAELLLKEKIINQQLFQEAENAARQGKDGVRYLIENKHISETKLLYFLSQKFGLPSINLDKFDIKKETLSLINKETILKTQAIPIQSNQGTVVVAVADPTNLSDIQNLKFNLKQNLEVVLTTFSSFDRAIEKHFDSIATMGEAIESYSKTRVTDPTNSGTDDLELVEVHDITTESVDQDAPVISLVNGILTQSIKKGASDIHIEPYEKRFRVRMRIDGSLVEVTEIPVTMKRAVVARIKIMSRMDIAESRIPQDGRIKLKLSNKEIDFRVSTLPTLFGEKVVLRLLDKGNLNLDLDALGFHKEQLLVFKKGIHSPNGVVLVTGPTGSGKTTTLYSALLELNKSNENISTVEDPVEYNLSGINQVQVHKDIGLTFSSVLRTMLRQDPDIILVGEIRDKDTAEVAIQAALTGHLVLSTVHTNDSASTITRLNNMGVESFLLTASINTIVAQRLLRMLCVQCKQENKDAKKKLIEMGVPENRLTTTKVYSPGGCEKCNQTGYKGRVAVYEVMDFNSELKEAVIAGLNSIELKKIARKSGMITLRESALTKVINGVTSLEEAITHTSEG